jgi:photosystem II stability/assembly factor-like uncharacterized protein
MHLPISIVVPNGYLSIIRPGVARAEARAGMDWSVEVVAGDADVCCLPAGDDGKTVFAGTQGSGLLRSVDYGRTFFPGVLDGRCVKAVAVSPANPDRIYAGVKPAALFRSDDAGKTWEELAGFHRIRRLFWFSPAETPFSPYVQAIAISGARPETVIVGIEAGAVVRSADGGQTWQGHRPGAMRDCHSLAADADGRFYEAGYGGGAFSGDGGVSWSRPQGLDRRYGWAVAADPGGSAWFISSSRGVEAHSDRADAAIWRCRAGGGWERVARGLPQPLN